MSLATRLRDLRLGKGQSLQDVASAIGVSKAHLWELEKSHSKNPSIELLTKIANHFDVTIKLLVGEDMEANKADEDLVRMFRQVGELESGDRQVLDDMIKSMIRRRRERDDPD